MVIQSLIPFPDQSARIHTEALQFRRLSPDERFRQIFDLIASGQALLANSPKRDVAQRLREQSEAEWQEAIKRFIACHHG